MTRRAWSAAIQNREEKFELKRRAVLLTAARLIRRVGFERLSLGDIAVELHVAKPTIYYYFRNKDDIVRELMSIAVANFMAADDHPEDYPDAPGLSGAVRLERFLRRCVRAVGDDIGGSLFAVYFDQLADTLRNELNSIGAPVISWGHEILRSAVMDGTIEPCDPIMTYQFIIASLRGVPTIVHTQRVPLERAADAMVQFVMRGLATNRTQ